MDQAKKIFPAIDDEEEGDMNEFKASEGWLQKFLARNNLTTRKPTTICQKPPADYEEQLVKFVLFVESMRKKKAYQYIYAADETAVFLDFSGSLCIDTKGSKEVRFKLKFLITQFFRFPS